MFTFPMFYVYISRSVSQLKPFFWGGVADGELQDFKEFHTNSELALFLLDRYVCILHVCVCGECSNVQKYREKRITRVTANCSLHSSLSSIVSSVSRGASGRMISVVGEDAVYISQLKL